MAINIFSRIKIIKAGGKGNYKNLQGLITYYYNYIHTKIYKLMFIENYS